MERMHAMLPTHGILEIPDVIWNKRLTFQRLLQLFFVFNVIDILPPRPLKNKNKKKQKKKKKQRKNKKTHTSGSS